MALFSFLKDAVSCSHSTSVRLVSSIMLFACGQNRVEATTCISVTCDTCASRGCGTCTLMSCLLFSGLDLHEISTMLHTLHEPPHAEEPQAPPSLTTLTKSFLSAPWLMRRRNVANVGKHVSSLKAGESGDKQNVGKLADFCRSYFFWKNGLLKRVYILEILDIRSEESREEC